MNFYKRGKQIFCFVLLCSFILLSIPARVSFAADGSTTVYITNAGEKYHTGNCQYLRKSKISISLQDAVLGEYTACSKCHPPQLTQTSAEAANSSVQPAYTGLFASYVTAFEERYENGLIDESLLEECYQLSDPIYYNDTDLATYCSFTDEQDMDDFSYYILLRTYDNMAYARQHPEIFYTESFHVDDYFLSCEELWHTIGYDVNTLYQHYLKSE